MDKKRVLIIGEASIPYEIIRNNRLKSIKISMNMDGMKVSAPQRVSIKRIEEILESKREWIYKNHLKLKAVKDNIYERQWVSGEKVLYRGMEYGITVYGWDSRTKLSFDGQVFSVYVDKSLEREGRSAAIYDAFRKFFIDMARKEIDKGLRFYSSVIGVSYNDVRIKEQKTRWGSCSKKKNLNFNWRLILAPPWVMDYVIVHELCHLIHLNHSKEFWDTVASYMPDYKKAKNWLKENGMKLKI